MWAHACCCCCCCVPTRPPHEMPLPIHVVHTCGAMLLRACSCTYTHMHTCTRTHTHTHTHTHLHVGSHIHASTRGLTHSRIYTRAHACTHVHTCTHTCTCRPARAHTFMYFCTHVQPRAHPRVHIHVHTGMHAQHAPAGTRATYCLRARLRQRLCESAWAPLLEALATPLTACHQTKPGAARAHSCICAASYPPPPCHPT